MAIQSNLYLFALHDNNFGNNEEGDLDFISSLVNCANLEVVSISANNFGGVLTESISNLSRKLRRIDFRGNQISGNIPVGVGNLINLETINFDDNRLTCTLPMVWEDFGVDVKGLD
ncbi:hypothetical protein DVH24_023335 [Malus domestica]|uniref:Leucine-rich repeat-containing N-terminal plant-type domain-containing protein n=1 Tax=Malus domestica TaxID=3750 RepID=A0A498KRV3_MALDO|nr:hypothetical protein DVH24_023335 [Malus domestica]